MIMKCNHYVHKHKFENKATSKIKLHHIPPSFGLDNDDIYLRDGPISKEIGSNNFHPSKETQWAAYFNENLSDSYGITPPKKLSNFSKN